MKHRINWTLMSGLLMAVLSIAMFVVGCVGCSAGV